MRVWSRAELLRLQITQERWHTRHGARTRITLPAVTGTNSGFRQIAFAIHHRAANGGVFKLTKPRRLR
jgi:hypothetical protein